MDDKWIKMAKERRLDYGTVKARVEGFGHTLMTKEYLNNRQKLALTCSCGQHWSATYMDVIRGRTCHGRPAKVAIADAARIATLRGGRCLSVEIGNSKLPLIWSCKNNHIFTAPFDSVRGTANRRGTWCPKCTKFVTQELCRGTIELAFQTSFPESRPGWLTYDNGKRLVKLTLDGYAADLRIAWEYQGHYHYKERDDSKPNLLTRQLYDMAKVSICKDQGVKLVVIDLMPPNLSIVGIVEAIKLSFTKAGIPFPDVDSERINIEGAYSSSKAFSTLKNMAVARGGRLTSTTYLGIDKKHEFECIHGHRFPATAASIIHGKSWCPCRQCAGLERFTVTELTEFYAAKGFELISSEYVNVESEMTLRCQKCGAIFSGRHRNHRYNNLTCPGECLMGRPRQTKPFKYDLSLFQAKVMANGDELLATEYIGLSTKYSVKCRSCCEVRQISGSAIDKGGGCSCKKGGKIALSKKRYFIDDVKELACRHGCRCLSFEMQNVRQTLEFECLSCGSKFFKTGAQAMKGGFCRRCSHRGKKVYASCNPT